MKQPPPWGVAHLFGKELRLKEMRMCAWGVKKGVVCEECCVLLSWEEMREKINEGESVVDIFLFFFCGVP